MPPLATRLRLIRSGFRNPLSEASGNLKFAPAVKRIEISRPKEKKLAILRNWYYALVPDEKTPTGFVMQNYSAK